mmetsp:Transcript_91627/g.158883  ORF Transcript_91627/g.158883 Transcript_91627/m.158883 type:complete len:85 (+) Transcript_91627:845-1099(+)
MVDHSATDKAAIDKSEREEKLLYDKSVGNISNWYHHPDGFFARDFRTSLIHHAGLKIERVHEEGLTNTDGRSTRLLVEHTTGAQ